MAATPSVNIVIPQGSEFTETFLSTETNGDTTNLAGYIGEAKLKKHAGSATSFTFSVSITAASGEVSIGMTSGATALLEPGRYVYDVVLTSSSGAKSRLVEGMSLVTAGITL
jgi:hypothetical protein